MNELYREYLQQLVPVLGEREAASVLRILLEDSGIAQASFLAGNFEPISREVFESYMLRLLHGEPVQYITGKTNFFGTWLKVSPAVLIPRPETEELVDTILQDNKQSKSLRLLDIGTGSGCIPVVIRKKRPDWEVFACDVSKEALALANQNALENHVDITFFEENILKKDALSLRSNFDIIVSNPPYIPDNEKALMPVQVLDHEPALALFVTDEDPLIFYRVISQLAANKLNPGGCLYFECNEFNAVEVIKLMQKAGFIDCILLKDFSGKDRIAKGRIQTSFIK